MYIVIKVSYQQSPLILPKAQAAPSNKAGKSSKSGAKNNKKEKTSTTSVRNSLDDYVPDFNIATYTSKSEKKENKYLKIVKRS